MNVLYESFFILLYFYIENSSIQKESYNRKLNKKNIYAIK